MMRLSFSACAGLLALAAASPAVAADLPSPSYPAYKAPIYSPTPVFSWTGFYAGVNAGWGWSNGDGNITLGGSSTAFSSSGDGFLGGAQVGYNFQTGSFVFGLEADFQGSTGKGDLNTTVGAAVITSTAKNPWFGTLRGRLGYAFDRSMIYATGGAVYGKSTLDGTVSTTGSFSTSSNYWSWTAGAGYEAMLWDRWSYKIEYLYVGKPSDAPVPPGTTALTGDVHTSIVRAGLNYHF